MITFSKYYKLLTESSEIVDVLKMIKRNPESFKKLLYDVGNVIWEYEDIFEDAEGIPCADNVWWDMKAGSPIQLFGIYDKDNDQKINGVIYGHSGGMDYVDGIQKSSNSKIFDTQSLSLINHDNIFTITTLAVDPKYRMKTNELLSTFIKKLRTLNIKFIAFYGQPNTYRLFYKQGELNSSRMSIHGLSPVAIDNPETNNIYAIFKI